jgi:two-component system, OmpR family, clock-associated histidine kinase SasA
LWLNIIFILIFAIGLQPLLRWAQNTVDRWFYRGRYDYLNALEGLAEETKAITDLDFIANAMVNTITHAMRCANVLVLLPDVESKYYVSALQQGEKKSNALRFNRDSALIWWMSQNKGFLTRQDASILPQLKALTEQEKRILAELNAELFIPLTTREGLRGILILGKKLSEQDYSPEEIRLLRVAANQMATVVENARLYDLQTRRYQEQSLLARFSMTVAAELDFSQVFRSLMKEIQDVVSINYAALMLVDEQENKPPEILEYSQIPDFHPDILKGVFSLENIARVGESNYEPDIWQDNASPLREPLTKAGLRSLLYLPLLSKGNVTGYLAIASKETDAYNEDYIRLLKQIAVQMAIAYEKSRLYELERKARLELEKQDKERTEFINSLIHEIKTPITAMLASCDLLSEELASSPGVLGELAENLSTAITNLNRRVSELTDFAKLQNTEMKVNLQKVDMHKLTERADSLISSLLQSRNQMLNFDLKAAPHVVKADPDRVIQILLNLLTNASKYGKPYKEIYLKTYNSGGFLVTEVKDSAAPLLQEDKESLFRPYNLARKKESGGLGLGLFVCKKLVELHGGKIWLEADASGNQFKFSLPLITQEEGN